MTPEEYGEQYVYKNIAEYEEIVGYKTNEAFKTGWMMARVKNKHLGITQEEKQQTEQ